MKKNYCNICKKNNFLFSKKNKLNKTKSNWIHESTASLINLKNQVCYMGFCKNCFVAKIFPEFNSNLLYKKNGAQIRKKYFEKYNPGQNYDNLDNTSFIIKNKYLETEVKRIRYISKKFNYYLSKNFSNQKKISILDYGGGDGYLSKIVFELFKLITDKKITLSNYDPLFKPNFKKTSYDFIIISHVLEHIHKLENVLNLIKNISNKNTIIFIEVPDDRYIVFKKFFLNENVYLHYHVNYFSVESLKKLFSKFNFNTNFSYRISSYRGRYLTVISGFAGKNICDQKWSMKKEILSIFKYLFNKILCKII